MVIGGVAEIGTGHLNDHSHGSGVVRMTPFVGVWLQGLGSLRIGYGLFNYTEHPENGKKQTVEQRDFTVQLGVSAGLAPSFLLSYTRARSLSSLGDASWNEWGAGIGVKFQIIPTVAFVSEMEYRWITEYYDPLHNKDVSGTRLQMNLGFLFYVY